MLLFSACFGDESADVVVEVAVLFQLFDADVHPPSPVVVRIGRYVDAFDGDVRVAE